ncbi:MAG TPA: lipopolysaccharide assembly protein LapA domain-containing protein [Acidimicrobiales bacterium]|nr:lipopolysaccharide assembly protein LapA domain-containing protein [Acidimicrobiales bacterium]
MTVARQQQPVAERAVTEHSAVESPARSQSRTKRVSATWFGILSTALVLVLVLLLIFILQNTRSVKITYFTANGTVPVGVALLFAAIGGMLLASLVALLRVWHLHHGLAKGGTPEMSIPPFEASAPDAPVLHAPDTMSASEAMHSDAP